MHSPVDLVAIVFFMVPVQRLIEWRSPPELALDPDGVPCAPVVVINTDDARGELSPADLELAASRIRAAGPLIVALTRTETVLEPIASASDVSLALSARGQCHNHTATVGSADPESAASELAQRAARASRATLTLTWLLRAGERLDVLGALVAESCAYSMLLGSAEFAQWLAARGPARPADLAGRVRLRRDDNELTITLARPARRNAVDARMRDALLEALAVAEADPELRVTLDGDGPAFSAGGDLDEFGTARDPAAAHIVRVTASPAAALHRIRDRVTARVHGACIGAGIELPAFAGRVTATPDAVFGLPEIAMGLVPGAGGTVSIARRIGRQRTLWLAVSGQRLDARTALAWGLVDAIDQTAAIPPAR
jgi:enoyl-CoA hydratase/carnithine racemase